MLLGLIRTKIMETSLLVSYYFEQKSWSMACAFVSLKKALGLTWQ